MRAKTASPVAALQITAALAGLTTGCATYSLPTVRLESPEVTGRVHQTKLEPLALLAGTDLVSAPVWSAPDPEEGTTSKPYAQTTIKPAVGGVFGLSETVDIGLRIIPQAPPLLRGKIQLSGVNESKAQAGNFAISLSAAVGYLTGTMSGQPTSFFAADFALPVGYRFNAHHLVFLSPFLTLGSADGLTQSAALTTVLPTGQRTSISATQYGAGLGYQFDLKYLDLRAELAYALGSAGATSISALGFGALVAFEL